MDIVEIDSISSISEATASFFAALASLHELQSESAASVAKIQKLRNNLAPLDRNGSKWSSNHQGEAKTWQFEKAGRVSRTATV